MIKYQLTPESTAAFLEAVLSDTFEALATDRVEEQDIFVTVGNREIRIPTSADAYEALASFVKECEEVAAHG